MSRFYFLFPGWGGGERGREDGGEERRGGGVGGGLSKREIGKGNPMTVLRFQTRGLRHQPPWPPFGSPVLTIMETNSVQTTVEILSQKDFSFVSNKDTARRLLTLCLLGSSVLLVLVPPKNGLKES